jgi:hypothetical protein
VGRRFQTSNPPPFLRCHARESGHPVQYGTLDSRLRGNAKALAVRGGYSVAMISSERTSSSIRRMA